MECSTVLSLAGLSLDIAGVILLTFVATPAHIYTPDGSDHFFVVPDSEKTKENAKKFHQRLA